MSEQEKPWFIDQEIDRRQFLRSIGAGVAILGAAGLAGIGAGLELKDALFPSNDNPYQPRIMLPPNLAIEKEQKPFTLEDPLEGQPLEVEIYYGDRLDEGVDPLITCSDPYLANPDNDQTTYAKIAFLFGRPVIHARTYEEVTPRQLKSAKRGEGLIEISNALVRTLSRFTNPRSGKEIRLKKIYPFGLSRQGSVTADAAAHFAESGVEVGDSSSGSIVTLEDQTVQQLTDNFRSVVENPLEKMGLYIADRMHLLERMNIEGDPEHCYVYALTKGSYFESMDTILRLNRKSRGTLIRGREDPMCPANVAARGVAKLNADFNGRMIDAPLPTSHDLFTRATEPWPQMLRRYMGLRRLI